MNNILLIDDDFATNYIHKKLLSNTYPEAKVHVARNGYEAIDLLSGNNTTFVLTPDLIFLDINMPLINGWEFLEIFEKLNYYWIKQCILLMVSTSINPDDETKSKAHPLVNGFVNKPLTRDIISGIYEKYFAHQKPSEN